jgi:hypothetical protein
MLLFLTAASGHCQHYSIMLLKKIVTPLITLINSFVKINFASFFFLPYSSFLVYLQKPT